MRGMRLLTGTVALLLSGLVSLHAQDPSARVARASYLQGEVSFRPGTVDDWTSATLNYPLTTGDHLWTDADARAELHVGSSAIRLGPQTAFEILSLDDNHLQINLTQGSALIRLRTLDRDDNVEIDTPTGAVTLMRTGTYRVDVSADGATSTVTVRNGDAEVTSNNSTVRVRRDETVLFTNDGASPDVRNAASYDEYDQWAAARDRQEDRSVSARYVSRDMTGYEDLDAYGRWSDDPDYGHVWVPVRVASDWAPYRYGRWVWVEPWGWTWIDDAPWGFAPFHYGRWAYVRERWVWAPGVVVARPVYAPALVAFVGGSHFSVSVNFGSRGGVAWFPLAPGEMYRPAYRVSDRYARNVNVTNVNVTNVNVTNVNVTNVNVTNIHYRNQSVAGAVTAVPNETFAGSRRIGRGAVIVPVGEARTAHVVGDGAPVTPTQQSIFARRQGVAVARPPEAVMSRPVVWKNTPPPAPATFASHAAQLQTRGDRPVTPLPVSETRGAPRVQATSGLSHTDGPARVNGSANAGPAHTVAPNTTVRSAEPVRPNVNVRAYPNAEPNQNIRPTPNTQPNTNVRPAPRMDAAPPANDRPRAEQQPRMRPLPQDERRAPPAGETTRTTQQRQPTDQATQARRQVEGDKQRAGAQQRPRQQPDDSRPPRHR